MATSSPASRPEPSAALFLAAAFVLFAFHLVGVLFFDGFALDLGSLNFPTPRYFDVVRLWTVFGGLSAVLLALAMARFSGSPSRIARVTAIWQALSDRCFLAWACAAAFALPLALRHWLLHGAPLADDESAYRFAAELLSTGRLWVASPGLKLFFDQNFMINDGRLYPVYVLGWPALLAPATRIGATGILNPLLSALTIPPLFAALRQLFGSSWARAGVVLFLSAPFLQIAAATQLSHTSCLMALTWCLWMYLRTQRPDASGRDHAGFACGFALAFCIRPQSAAPLALPLLLSWVLALRHLHGRPRLKAVLAFLGPTIGLASLFLGSLLAQNGSPWRMGYERYGQYIRDNQFRFTSLDESDLTTLPGFDFSRLRLAIAHTVSGMLRLNYDLFGWPSSLALAALAWSDGSRRAKVIWMMCGSYLVLLLFQRDWGIDTFGPVHAFELALPVLCLTIAGARHLGERLTRAPVGRTSAPPGEQWSVVAPSLLAALIVTAWLGFIPVRLGAVRQIAAHVNLALQAPARAGLHHALIFSPQPFAPSCGGVPSHFVLFRPVNDPDLRNDVLWVNHINVEEDRRLAESMPGRVSYVMQWTKDCQVILRPLATATAADVPPGITGRQY